MPLRAPLCVSTCARTVRAVPAPHALRARRCRRGRGARRCQPPRRSREDSGRTCWSGACRSRGQTPQRGRATPHRREGAGPNLQDRDLETLSKVSADAVVTPPDLNGVPEHVPCTARSFSDPERIMLMAHASCKGLGLSTQGWRTAMSARPWGLKASTIRVDAQLASLSIATHRAGEKGAAASLLIACCLLA